MGLYVGTFIEKGLEIFMAEDEFSHARVNNVIG
jgi:hypothetical protein